jgi:hypothetical protein
MTTETNAPIYALTSLCPRADQSELQKESIASWIKAGCEVIAFQSPEDMKQIHTSDWDGVCFVETESSKQFPNYVPISNMIEWASKQEGHSILINADCRLCISPQIMKSLAVKSKDGLVYLVRHDVDESGQIQKYDSGIDGFLLPNEYASLIPHSDIYCMGKPWWDYLLPMSILRNNKIIASPSFQVLYHTIHQIRWSHEEWEICRDETYRLFDWKSGPAEMLINIIKNTQTINYDPSWETK